MTFASVFLLEPVLTSKLSGSSNIILLRTRQKSCRNAVAFQVILTQSSAKFAENPPIYLVKTGSYMTRPFHSVFPCLLRIRCLRMYLKAAFSPL